MSSTLAVQKYTAYPFYPTLYMIDQPREATLRLPYSFSIFPIYFSSSKKSFPHDEITNTDDPNKLEFALRSSDDVYKVPIKEKIIQYQIIQYVNKVEHVKNVYINLYSKMCFIKEL